MQSVYLICGVSGSGKSWVCRQLVDKCCYIPHDKHYDDHVNVVYRAALVSLKPIITECPFGERVLREALEALKITVIPYFVIEVPEVIARRYYEREKKPLPANARTRAKTIVDRAKEWGAPNGSSNEVLAMLKRVFND